MMTNEEKDKLLCVLDDAAFDVIKDFNPSVKWVVITIDEESSSHPATSNGVFD